MFLAPGLYVIYALLYGIFTMVTVALGFRAGFSFSAGAMDLLFSSSLPAAARTWLIIPLGIAAFIVFYIVFYFAIKKWNLKTPGREDDDVEAEKKAVLSNNDYTAVAKTILEGCGGKDNIASIDNCITRLRLEVKDITQVDDKKIKYCRCCRRYEAWRRILFRLLSEPRFSLLRMSFLSFASRLVCNIAVLIHIR